MRWLWPIQTGTTMFDVWSIVHLCFWLVLGANWEAVRVSRHWQQCWAAVLGSTLALALLWEVFERWYAEPHGWVAHPEVWFNRWLSDPLVGLTGVALGILLISRQ
jgi:hypothetical protein